MNYTIRGKQFEAKEREVWAIAERWEPETFDVLDKYIVPGKVFIDIGAWCGIFSLYAERLGTEVHAVEPDPAAAAECDDNIDLNDSAIILHEVGITDKNERQLLRTVSSWGDSESSFILRKKEKQSVYIYCLTLDSFVSNNLINPQNICLIKMDVEGAEMMILKEAEPFLKKYKPPMWISFHPGYFEDLGESVRTLIDILFPVYDCGLSKAAFANRLIIPSAFHSFLFLPK
jgi:FkbM family methyltransferase